MVFDENIYNFASNFSDLMVILMLKRAFLLTICILCGVVVMAQKNDSTTTDSLPEWVSKLAQKVEMHGYAQAGYTWKHQDGVNSNGFDLKRVLFWVKAKVF